MKKTEINNLKTFISRAQGIQVNIADLQNIKAIVSNTNEVEVDFTGLQNLKKFISNTENIQIKLKRALEIENRTSEVNKVKTNKHENFNSIEVLCTSFNSHNKPIVNEYILYGTGPKAPRNARILYGTGPRAPRNARILYGTGPRVPHNTRIDIIMPIVKKEPKIV